MRMPFLFLLLVLLTAGAAGAQAPLLELDRQNLMEEAVLPNVQVTVIGQPFHFFAVAWSPSNSGLNVNGVDFQLGAADTTIIVSGQLDGNGRGTTAFDPNVGHDTIYLQGATASDPGFVNLVPTPPKTIQVVSAGAGQLVAGGPIASNIDRTVYHTWFGQGQALTPYNTLLPVDCAAEGFMVRVDRTLVGSEIITVTLTYDGVETVMSCTINAGSDGCDAGGNTHTFEQGHVSSVKVTFMNISGGNALVSHAFVCR